MSGSSNDYRTNQPTERAHRRQSSPPQAGARPSIHALPVAACTNQVREPRRLARGSATAIQPALLRRTRRQIMLQSETTADLSAALVKAQAAMKSAAFNKVNPHFKNRYADLAAIIDAVRKPLTDNNLSFTQTTEVHVDGAFLLVTTLRHASGQWIAGTYPLPREAKSQELGSALTYAKRYTLSSITGIAADEDDDAEATRKNGNGAVTAEQAQMLSELAAKKKVDVNALLKLTHAESISDIPAAVFVRAKNWIEAHK